MQIRTDNEPRDVIFGHELTDEERDEFDFLNFDVTHEFFRYKDEVYYLGDFMVPPFGGWDGYMSDSFFSGLLIKYVDDMERVIVGRYCT